MLIANYTPGTPAYGDVREKRALLVPAGKADHTAFPLQVASYNPWLSMLGW